MNRYDYEQAIQYGYEDLLSEGFGDILKDKFTKFRTISKETFVNPLMSLFNKVNIDNEKGIIEIRGVNIKELLKRIKEMYKERGLHKLFDKKYRLYDELMFNKQKISRGKMTIDNLYVHTFFALELVYIFNELYDTYNYKPYLHIANEIRKKTWVDNKLEVEEFNTDVSKLSEIKYTLKDYQLEFVKKYNYLKKLHSLDGYILSFQQGLGKTLTAVSLAEVLNKDLVIIVCPDAIRENWAYELKAYYKKYDNDELWKDEVYVIDHKKYKHSDKTKFVIGNNASIDKFYKYCDKNKDTMIIVDESHYFRNMNSKRSQQLIELKNKSGSKDNLMMSGTPIKATPSELSPALAMIDPTFTPEVAKVYDKCFNLDNMVATKIVQDRFSMVMYRKTKSVLDLPEKIESKLGLSIKGDPSKFYVTKMKEDIRDIFSKEYEERLKSNESLRDELSMYVNNYSSSDSKDKKEYLSWLNSVNTEKQQELHELKEKFVKEYLIMYVLPNISDKNKKDRVNELSKKFIGMKRSAMATAVAQVYPPRRKELFIKLYEDNKAEIIKSIKENPMKTVIFSQLVPVIEHIVKDLNDNGIGTVKVSGSTPSQERMEVIEKFKYDDNISVICATSQTLSTGVTLTEASLMYFFGAPWRHADYEQASDRIHRIGQKSDVRIINVVLDTGKNKNISSRMDEIMEWSGGMSQGLLSATVVNENTNMYNSHLDILDESTMSIGNISPILKGGNTMKHKLLTEAELTGQQRKRMHDDTFGLHQDGERKFPMNDLKHVRSAITYFHTVEDKKDRKELASKIVKRAKELGGKGKVMVHEGNPLYKENIPDWMKSESVINENISTAFEIIPKPIEKIILESFNIVRNNFNVNYTNIIDNLNLESIDWNNEINNLNESIEIRESESAIDQDYNKKLFNIVKPVIMARASDEPARIPVINKGFYPCPRANFVANKMNGGINKAEILNEKDIPVNYEKKENEYPAMGMLTDQDHIKFAHKFNNWYGNYMHMGRGMYDPMMMRQWHEKVHGYHSQILNEDNENTKNMLKQKMYDLRWDWEKDPTDENVKKENLIEMANAFDLTPDMININENITLVFGINDIEIERDTVDIMNEGAIRDFFKNIKQKIADKLKKKMPKRRDDVPKIPRKVAEAEAKELIKIAKDYKKHVDIGKHIKDDFDTEMMEDGFVSLFQVNAYDIIDDKNMDRYDVAEQGFNKFHEQFYKGLEQIMVSKNFKLAEDWDRHEGYIYLEVQGDIVD